LAASNSRKYTGISVISRANLILFTVSSFVAMC